MLDESAPKLSIQKLAFPSGREVILFQKGSNDLQGFERYKGKQFTPLDSKILERTLSFVFDLPKSDQLELANGVKVERLKVVSLSLPERKKAADDSPPRFHKGEPCWIKPEVFCQEGFCSRCVIYAEAKLCISCWEERGQYVKFEPAPSRSLANRFVCPKCGEEYLFAEEISAGESEETEKGVQ